MTQFHFRVKEVIKDGTKQLVDPTKDCLYTSRKRKLAETSPTIEVKNQTLYPHYQQMDGPQISQIYPSLMILISWNT